MQQLLTVLKYHRDEFWSNMKLWWVTEESHLHSYWFPWFLPVKNGSGVEYRVSRVFLNHRLDWFVLTGDDDEGICTCTQHTLSGVWNTVRLWPVECWRFKGVAHEHSGKQVKDTTENSVLGFQLPAICEEKFQMWFIWWEDHHSCFYDQCCFRTQVKEKQLGTSQSGIPPPKLGHEEMSDNVVFNHHSE